jgi:5-methylcytosine-specific restriction enzyme A
MSLMARSFRSKESYVAEKKTRNMLATFLTARGFADVRDERTSSGPAERQVLRAIDDRGQPVALWVRLCWRQSGARKGKHIYSAAQLMARVRDEDWIGTIRKRLNREKQAGISHLLLVQRVGNVIQRAAAIPLALVLSVWKTQRDRSDKLIRQGKLGRRTKNHNMNGSSPSLWLEDSAAPEIGAVLWAHKGVRDLAKLAVLPQGHAARPFDDSMDDLPGLDYALLGSDGARRIQRMTSGVKRDPKVRSAVLARSEGACERAGCGIAKGYSGFLDVHHILGVGRSDRPWNCVALCPNCHREAHAAPAQMQINAALLKFASRFRRGSKA